MAEPGKEILTGLAGVAISHPPRTVEEIRKQIDERREVLENAIMAAGEKIKAGGYDSKASNLWNDVIVPYGNLIDVVPVGLAYGKMLSDPEAQKLGPMVAPSYENLKLLKKHWDSPEVQYWRATNYAPFQAPLRAMYTASKLTGADWTNVTASHIVPSWLVPEAGSTPKDMRFIRDVAGMDRSLWEKAKAIYYSPGADSYVDTVGPLAVDLPLSVFSGAKAGGKLMGALEKMRLGARTMEARGLATKFFSETGKKVTSTQVETFINANFRGPLTEAFTVEVKRLVNLKRNREVREDLLAETLTRFGFKPKGRFDIGGKVERLIGTPLPQRLPATLENLRIELEDKNRSAMVKVKKAWENVPTLQSFSRSASELELKQFAEIIGNEDNLRSTMQMVAEGKMPPVSQRVVDAATEYVNLTKSVMADRSAFWTTEAGIRLRSSRVRGELLREAARVAKENPDLAVALRNAAESDKLMKTIAIEGGQVIEKKSGQVLITDKEIAANIADNFRDLPRSRDWYSRQLVDGDGKPFKLAENAKDRSFLHQRGVDPDPENLRSGLMRASHEDVASGLENLLQSIRTQPSGEQKELNSLDIVGAIEGFKKRVASGRLGEASVSVDAQRELLESADGMLDWIKQAPKEQGQFQKYAERGLKFYDDVHHEFKKAVLFSPLTFPRYLFSNISDNNIKNMVAMGDDFFKNHRPYDVFGNPHDALQRFIPKSRISNIGEAGFDALRPGTTGARATYSKWIDEANEVAEHSRQILFSHAYWQKFDEMMPASEFARPKAPTARMMPDADWYPGTGVERPGPSVAKESIERYGRTVKEFETSNAAKVRQADAAAKAYAHKTVSEVQFFHDEMPTLLRNAERAMPFFGTFIWPTFKYNVKMLATQPAYATTMNRVVSLMRDGQEKADGTIEFDMPEGGKMRVYPARLAPAERLIGTLMQAPSPLSGDDESTAMMRLGRGAVDTFGSIVRPSPFIGLAQGAMGGEVGEQPGYDWRLRSHVRRLAAPFDIAARLVAGAPIEQFFDVAPELRDQFEKRSDFEYNASLAFDEKPITREEAASRARNGIRAEAMVGMPGLASDYISGPAAEKMLGIKATYEAIATPVERQAFINSFNGGMLNDRGKLLLEEVVHSPFYIQPGQAHADTLLRMQAVLDDPTAARAMMSGAKADEKASIHSFYGVEVPRLPHDAEPVRALPRVSQEGPFRAEAMAAAQKSGIRPELFLALVQQESAWNPKAVSRVGAIGLGQLMPATAKELGVDPADPIQNLDGSARYLAQKIKEFDGNEALGLAAYNAGAAAVRSASGIPQNGETPEYVDRILGMADGGSTPPIGGQPPNSAGGFSVDAATGTVRYAQQSALDYKLPPEVAAELAFQQATYRGTIASVTSGQVKEGQTKDTFVPRVKQDSRGNAYIDWTPGTEDGRKLLAKPPFLDLGAPARLAEEQRVSVQAHNLLGSMMLGYKEATATGTVDAVRRWERRVADGGFKYGDLDSTWWTAKVPVSADGKETATRLSIANELYGSEHVINGRITKFLLPEKFGSHTDMRQALHVVASNAKFMPWEVLKAEEERQKIGRDAEWELLKPWVQRMQESAKDPIGYSASGTLGDIRAAMVRGLQTDPPKDFFTRLMTRGDWDTLADFSIGRTAEEGFRVVGHARVRAENGRHYWDPTRLDMLRDNGYAEEIAAYATSSQDRDLIATLGDIGMRIDKNEVAQESLEDTLSDLGYAVTPAMRMASAGRLAPPLPEEQELYRKLSLGQASDAEQKTYEARYGERFEKSGEFGVADAFAIAQSGMELMRPRGGVPGGGGPSLQPFKPTYPTIGLRPEDVRQPIQPYAYRGLDDFRNATVAETRGMNKLLMEDARSRFFRENPGKLDSDFAKGISDGSVKVAQTNFLTEAARNLAGVPFSSVPSAARMAAGIGYSLGVVDYDTVRTLDRGMTQLAITDGSTRVADFAISALASGGSVLSGSTYAGRIEAMSKSTNPALRARAGYISAASFGGQALSFGAGVAQAQGEEDLAAGLGTAGGALQGAAFGASVGGPVGAAVGFAIGGALGYFTSTMGRQNEDRQRDYSAARESYYAAAAENQRRQAAEAEGRSISNRQRTLFTQDAINLRRSPQTAQNAIARFVRRPQFGSSQGLIQATERSAGRQFIPRY